MSLLQSFYDWSLVTDRRAENGSKIARVFRRLSLPFQRRFFTAQRIVTTETWGQKCKLAANHHLPRILARNAKWSQSLVHAALAIQKPQLSIIDIGANIGDSVLLLQQAMPGACTVLCVEPDPNYADLCAANIAGLRAELVRDFIGEANERLVSSHETAGTAGSLVSEAGQQSRRLDELAQDFVARHGLDMIKVDTDGYDFKVLRSASALIEKHKPVLFFELHIPFWSRAGESGIDCLRWLATKGYSHLAFFDDASYFYAASSVPDEVLWQAVCSVSAANQRGNNPYFDVVATVDSAIRDRAVDLNLKSI